MNLNEAIRSGNANALLQLLAEDPSRANELIEWGNEKKCFTHPLHYISDMLFNGTMQRGKELPLVDALIEAGANLNFNKDGKSETPLVGAEPRSRRRRAQIARGWRQAGSARPLR